jgi:aldehyde dehydrogenase (NAD+)
VFADVDNSSTIAQEEIFGPVLSGTIGINKYLPDPAAPFGGVKASGIGRELGPGAISAYQQLKSIYA